MTSEEPVVLRISIECERLHDSNPAYRLYVDDDLITERTFIWGKFSYIQEHVFLHLTPGVHKVKLSTIKNEFMPYECFSIKNIVYDKTALYNPAKTDINNETTYNVQFEWQP